MSRQVGEDEAGEGSGALGEHVGAALLAVVVGVLAGSVCAAFLVALSFVTELRLDDPRWIYACPLLGAAVGLLVQYGARGSDVSVDAALESIHDPAKPVSLRAGVVVFLASLLTHLGGGSAGREGTGILLGAVCASAIARIAKCSAEATRILLLAGLAAGFTGTFGTPLAGIVFALEIASFGRVSYDGLLAVMVGAVSALLTTELWPVHHVTFPIGELPRLTAAFAARALFAGVVFGMVGLLFLSLLSGFRSLARRVCKVPWLRPALGGVVIAGVFALTQSQTYLGLGLATIEESFNTPFPWFPGFLKAIATAFTLGFGFKGGEVTPLFFVGASVGNGLEAALGLPFPLLAGMGLVGVLCGVANTPLAGVLLGIELFGAEAGLWCGIACVGSYLVVGHRGVYSAQRVGVAKFSGERGQEGQRVGALKNL